MARPTKITDEKKLKLADFIRSGLTIKDACCGVSISPSTFNRLRAKDIEFDKLINEATEGSWSNAEALAKYHYRGYKRKNPPKHIIQPDYLPTSNPEVSQTRDEASGSLPNQPKNISWTASSFYLPRATSIWFLL